MAHAVTPLAGALALVFGAVTAASAQSIRGVLLETDGREPIVAGTMTLLDHDGRVVAETLTTDSGTFVLEAEQRGAYWIRGEALGFRSAWGGPIELGSGVVVDVEFRLAVSAVILDAMTVVSVPRESNLERVGFYQRKRMGIGRFLAREDFERRPHSSTSDALRTVPGVRLVPRGGSQNFVMLGGSSRCGPQVFVDGVRLADRGNVDVVLPGDVDGIEIYRGSAGPPANYGGLDAGCGTILIWTREPGVP